MKNLFKATVTIVIASAFCFSSNLFGQEWSKEQTEVWKVIEEGWAAWKAGDIESSMADFHEKYQGWNQDKPIPVSKEKIKMQWMSMKEMVKVEYYDLEPVRITVTENAAVVHYYFEFYMVYSKGDDSKEKEVKGKNAEFYVKEDGKWLLLGDMTYFKGKKHD